MSEQRRYALPSGDTHGSTVGGISELGPRDYLYGLELDFDIDAQLIAVRGLLHSNRKAATELAAEIEQIEEHTGRLSGAHAKRAVNDWVEYIHHSVYQDAAHSMATVGMLAPLVETVFFQCFRRIGNRFFPASHPIQNHERWTAAHAIQWDCHMFHRRQSPREEPGARYHPVVRSHRLGGQAPG
jgi:uncharacterized membrane protein